MEELTPKHILDILVKILICIGIFYVGYIYGQTTIVESCKTASFFYGHNTTYECLPYEKGMLEPLRPPR